MLSVSSYLQLQNVGHAVAFIADGDGLQVAQDL
jgi:hypothetical protein